jgi:hypothetical protein
MHGLGRSFTNVQMRGFMRSALGRLLLMSAALAMLGSLSCFNLPTVRFDPPFGYGNWVQFEDAIVVGPPTPAIAGNFVNLKDSDIAVRIEIDEIAGGDDCANSFGFGPKEKRPYACPQSFVAEGKRYRVDVRVYKDRGETNLAERIQRIVTIETGEDGELILVGRPLE